MTHHLHSILRVIILIGLASLFAACPRALASDQAGRGFALLYSVADQEQNVDKLLWIKDPGKNIKAWIREIAAFNSEVSQQLESWQKSGKVEDLKDNGLPKAEQKARSIAKSQTMGDLLTSGQVDLRVALVVTQVKALAYCSNLCQATGELIEDAAIQKQLEQWQHRYAELKSDGMRLLELHYDSRPHSQKLPTSPSRR